MNIAKSLCSALLCNAWLVVPIFADNSSLPDQTVPVPELPGRGMESAQEKITDTWITAKVKSLFMYSKYVAANDIKVETADGVVMLSGNVDTENARDTAIELARSVHGVRKVNSNDLQVHNGDQAAGENP